MTARHFSVRWFSSRIFSRSLAGVTGTFDVSAVSMMTVPLLAMPLEPAPAPAPAPAAPVGASIGVAGVADVSSPSLHRMNQPTRIDWHAGTRLHAGTTQANHAVPTCRDH